ncbi:RHS repeat-associated core domain-containing protein [Variovorax boronicumulans]
MELTDEGGNIAWEANYKAWGEARLTISEAGRKAGLKNPIRFQGQYLDEETGLHYNRFRYYDPMVGRFVSKDPIGLLGGSNTHAFAPNPVQWIDPLGLSNKKTSAAPSCPRCDPCAGKNPAAEAQLWQGPKNAPYTGVDGYTNGVLKKGAVIYSLFPGNVPGFAVPIGTLNKHRTNPDSYHEALQVEKDSSRGPMRTQVQTYRVTEDICVAKGRATANGKFGDGGGMQYYIPTADRGKLTIGKTLPI